MAPRVAKARSVKKRPAAREASAKKTTKRATKKTAASRPDPGPLVHLRGAGGCSATIDLRTPECRAVMQQLAMRWAHVVRNRRRWSREATPSRVLAERATAALAEVGVTQEHLEALGRCDHVEVSMPFESEAVGWEARVFPWEYVLSAATKPFRGERGMLVTRHLQRTGTTPSFGERPQLLVVESAPGEIGDAYALDCEGRLVLASFGAPKQQPLRNPSVEDLRERVATMQPQALHFTGVDTRQAKELTSVLGGELEHDGLCLRDEDMRPRAVGTDEIARIFNAGRRKPALVSMTAFHTASRVCAMTVALGTGAAIGFQDRFDEVLAELFYTTFYRALALSGHDVYASFRVAWEALRARPNGLRGTGIVLWSSRSLLVQTRRDAWTKVQEDLLAERRRDWSPRRGGESLRDLVEVDVVPERRLNYAVLHNDCDLFETFVVRKLVPERVRDAQVHVELHVGTARFPFRGNVSLERPIEDLGAGIRVPLTWDLARSIVESVRTALFVDVRVGDCVLHRTTHAVELLPPNEWRDNEQDGPWLPSFVLPRDPAIEDIVAKAQRYLRALTDTPAAAFDGYQSVDPLEDDPGAVIDLQVRALWSALLHEFELGYVNPPPSYAPGHQRLRTPSDVIRSRTGTCIDLALLVASLLEYLEINPVLVLLDDHAFVGYWRTLDGYERFLDMARVFDGEAVTPEDDDLERPRGYVVGPQGYEELVALVESDDLVLLEATSLAMREGFAVAVEEGIGHLADANRFHSLLDVRLAREEGVTPLPLRGASRTGGERR